MRTFHGRTEDAQCPILGAEFWKEMQGKKITGRVTGHFDTKNGRCYNLDLSSAISLNGEKYDSAAVGALKGFTMALRAAGLENLWKDDLVVLCCTGVTPTDKGQPMINFEIEVSRELEEEVAY